MQAAAQVRRWVPGQPPFTLLRTGGPGCTPRPGKQRTCVRRPYRAAELADDGLRVLLLSHTEHR